MTKPTLKELIDAVFAGKTIQWNYLNILGEEWEDLTHSSQEKLISNIAEHFECYRYRIKPITQVKQYRAFLFTNGVVAAWYTGHVLSQKAFESSSDFKQWLGETQEYTCEVEE